MRWGRCPRAEGGSYSHTRAFHLQYVFHIHTKISPMFGQLIACSNKQRRAYMYKQSSSTKGMVQSWSNMRSRMDWVDSYFVLLFTPWNFSLAQQLQLPVSCRKKTPLANGSLSHHSPILPHPQPWRTKGPIEQECKCGIMLQQAREAGRKKRMRNALLYPPFNLIHDLHVDHHSINLCERTVLRKES